jgi:hypothetical protein
MNNSSFDKNNGKSIFQMMESIGGNIDGVKKVDIVRINEETGEMVSVEELEGIDPSRFDFEGFKERIKRKIKKKKSQASRVGQLKEERGARRNGPYEHPMCPDREHCDGRDGCLIYEMIHHGRDSEITGLSLPKRIKYYKIARKWFRVGRKCCRIMVKGALQCPDNPGSFVAKSVATQIISKNCVMCVHRRRCMSKPLIPQKKEVVGFAKDIYGIKYSEKVESVYDTVFNELNKQYEESYLTIPNHQAGHR